MIRQFPPTLQSSFSLEVAAERQRHTGDGLVIVPRREMCLALRMQLSAWGPRRGFEMRGAEKADLRLREWRVGATREDVEEKARGKQGSTGKEGNVPLTYACPKTKFCDLDRASLHHRAAHFRRDVLPSYDWTAYT